MKKEYKIKEPCFKFNLKSNSKDSSFHCETCSKTVTNLSTLENSELIETIANHEGTCVKVNPTKLKFISRLLTNSKRMLALASTVSIMTSSCNKRMILDNGEYNGKISITDNSEFSEEHTKNTISGKIISSRNGEYLIGTVIRINDTDVETISDIDGNFNLIIPKFVNEKQNIQFSYLGYETLEIEVSQLKGKEIIVSLGESMTIGYLEVIR